MTDIESLKHGSHNQKTHGNRYGKSGGDGDIAKTVRHLRGLSPDERKRYLSNAHYRRIINRLSPREKTLLEVKGKAIANKSLKGVDDRDLQTALLDAIRLKGANYNSNGNERAIRRLYQELATRAPEIFGASAAETVLRAIRSQAGIK